MKRYQFPDDPAAQSFFLFPSKLENDRHIFFHATPDINRTKIVAEGFKSAAELGIPGGLDSVSYAKNSNLAFDRATIIRGTPPQDVCIFVVKFDPSDFAKIEINSIEAFVYRPELQPTILGYCIMPSSFKYP